MHEVAMAMKWITAHDVAAARYATDRKNPSQFATGLSVGGAAPRACRSADNPARLPHRYDAPLPQSLAGEILRMTSAPLAPPGQPQPTLPPLIQAPKAKIDLISTAQAFFNAVAKGERDIVIDQHLDLRGFELNDYGYILSPSRTTRSILVRLPHPQPTAHMFTTQIQRHDHFPVCWAAHRARKRRVIMTTAGHARACELACICDTGPNQWQAALPLCRPLCNHYPMAYVML